MSAPATTLRVNEIDKSFGTLHAVDRLSFEIAAGETFGLLGPNGAGKTTAISIVCGLLRRDGGSVELCGTPIEVGSTAGRAAIGYVPQELAIYPDMSGRDNLRFFGRLYGLRGAAADRRIDAVLDVVGLRERAGDRASEYSGGMQRRLNIAAGMLHEPRLLILDEPTVGVDPQSRNAILDAVDALGQEGMSVLYTTHYMEEAERLCQRVAIIDHGRLLACGTRRELVATVGEHDIVTLTVLADAAAAAQRIEGLDGVLHTSATDAQTVTCVAADASGVLPRLLTDLLAAGHAVQNVEIREPSLDAVFLHLTGTALRD